MQTNIYIHAVNIHSGGGAVLLQGLLKALPTDKTIFLFVDARFIVPTLSNNITIYRFKPTILQRLHAEWLLHKQAKSCDTIFCFGNLPPLLPNAGRVILYLHNRYLLEKCSLAGFSWKTRARIHLERFWLHTFYRHVNKILVQTNSMRQLLKEQRLGQQRDHGIAPFMTYLPSLPDTLPAPKQFDFIYVASGDPHKNHRRLIEAWCLLAEQGLYPHLCLTLSAQENRRAHKLIDWIKKQQQQFKLNITHIEIDHGDALISLYQSANALIYPSLTESFGLPLIEAKQQNLAVLASELDFVRDIIVPNETFDPYSAVSIARAVQRFLGVTPALPPLLNPTEFALLLTT